ncbi:MAG TPA: type I-MYXAN CRISPR-associated protein Cmx8 [Blastocatellia bacterium]|nr:type I-MYXAN CRISPR-associated protein Cmx8 [Blastocatellia bacterium]
MAKKEKQHVLSDTLELTFELSELPSSQHRAGLAGLVLMCDWVQSVGTYRGLCELARLDQFGATLRIDQAGLKDLFDEAYCATMEEVQSERPYADKSGQKVTPKREEERETTDTKTGKKKTKAFFIYEKPVPKGAYLVDYDPTAVGSNGLWVKLWRDMVWNIFRGVPATRKPFEQRAKGLPHDDFEKAWCDLSKQSEDSVELASTYFLGAQAATAENVPFRDRAKYQFLLHFWPFVAQVYRPAVINNEGDREFLGYALAIPDVADLQTFCEELPSVLRGRGSDASGYLPRECVVDLAVEGALDVLWRLRDRLAKRAGGQSTRDLVLAVDVIHVDKQGNNIKVLGVARLEPEIAMIDKYKLLKDTLWNPIFRRRRLLNLVNGKPWHFGFDEVLARVPYKQLFDGQSVGFRHFRHDVQLAFEEEVINGTKRER